MGIKSFKPTSPSRRHMTVSTFEEITKKYPEKSLVVSLAKNAGRNSKGRITMRHRGGGAKKKYRIIDFKRDKDGIPGIVNAIEYDPNRSANIALIFYKDGEKRYILHPQGLKVGDTILSGENADIKVGNALKLKDIPVGTFLHNIVDLLDHVLITFLSFFSFNASTFFIRCSSTKGPFLIDLAIFPPYLVLLLIIIASDFLPFLRVFTPWLFLPQGVIGAGRPTGALPSPPP